MQRSACDPTAEDRSGDPGVRFEIRFAVPDDVGMLHRMIGELADYEHLTHLCIASEADVARALFSEHAAAEALIAVQNGSEVAGFALFFQSFSTFLGRRGLWLEDLFVRQDYRRRGCARTLLRAVAAIAVARGCGRFEWAVLDWNTPAIEFYRSLGASVLPDWRIVRMTGPALAALAGSSVEPAES
jgi:GNAT superfamily N-acetyltransferase